MFVKLWVKMSPNEPILVWDQQVTDATQKLEFQIPGLLDMLTIDFRYILGSKRIPQITM